MPGFTSDAFGGEWLQGGRAPASSKGEGSSSCRREKKGVFGVHVRTLALEGSAMGLGGFLVGQALLFPLSHQDVMEHLKGRAISPTPS